MRSSSPHPLQIIWAVYLKEMRDALRDRRTLLVVFFSSVLMGPLVLMALSSLIATLESQAEQREVLMVGIQNAPSLVNYLQRQTQVVKPAPADFEAQLRASKLGTPVVIVPSGFEQSLQRGEPPVVEVVSDSVNRRSEAGAGRITRLLAGFGRERATVQLALRGVSPQWLEPLQVQERDLASTQSRATQITGMLPFFALMAVLYGALNAALDTTAGERERGSLEPLLMNPAPHLALVFGKWGAVASVAFLIAILNCVSFLPAQWLLSSDTLAAMFQFGVREAALFLAILLPYAAAVSAVLMAVAIRCKTFKEAQASSTVVILLVSLLPMVSMFNFSGESPWHSWLPALGQHLLMMRILKGEDLGWMQLGASTGVSAVLTVIALWMVARHLRGAALKGGL
jgi:sodium transport system permease protein